MKGSRIFSVGLAGANGDLRAWLSSLEDAPDPILARFRVDMMIAGRDLWVRVRSPQWDEARGVSEALLQYIEGQVPEPANQHPEKIVASTSYQLFHFWNATPYLDNRIHWE